MAGKPKGVDSRKKRSNVTLIPYRNTCNFFLCHWIKEKYVRKDSAAKSINYFGQMNVIREVLMLIASILINDNHPKKEKY